MREAGLLGRPIVALAAALGDISVAMEKQERSPLIRILWARTLEPTLLFTP